MLFKMNRHTMLHISVFAMFAALAAPAFAHPGNFAGEQIAVEPGEEDAENGESSRSDEADQAQEDLDLSDADGVGERKQNNNPHNPDPQSPACKKKGQNEPDGCPGPR
jgi:hypothetical protein